MINTKAFDGLIGQESVKKRLSIYLATYKQSGSIPFFNFIAGAGFGKTQFCRTFRENMERPKGGRPPLLEVNAASIKNAKAFFEHIYPDWSNHKAFLFLDEAHNLPNDLQEILLTVLNTEKNKVRSITFQDEYYEFDFNSLCIALGTTDQQKLKKPFRDRFTDISFENYTQDQLFMIFRNSLKKEIFIRKEIVTEIISRFRGNPRDAVKKADDLFLFCSACGISEVNKAVWDDFCDYMGIMPYGLNHGEIQVLNAIGKSGSCSLNAITSITGLSRSAIQNDYECHLIRRRLMDIDGHRRLTPLGIALYRELQKTS